MNNKNKTKHSGCDPFHAANALKYSLIGQFVNFFFDWLTVFAAVSASHPRTFSNAAQNIRI